MYRTLIVLLSLLTVVSCREGSPLKETDENPVYYASIHLGQGYLDHVNNANRVVVTKIKPLDTDDYEFEPLSVDMNKEDISSLKDILLNDKSYLFDVRKKCVFIPEYALEFYVKGQKMLFLYAPLCKEFKVPYGHFKEQIIEIDPSFEKIEGLLEKYKNQLEVNDEN